MLIAPAVKDDYAAFGIDLGFCRVWLFQLQSQHLLLLQQGAGLICSYNLFSVLLHAKKAVKDMYACSVSSCICTEAVK